MALTHDVHVEPLWGARPLTLTPISERWALGRVVATAPGERSTQPRCGIWDLRNGKLACAISGAVAIGLSADEKQIGVWRERVESTPGRPFFDGNARSDYRWSFERRRWPKHERVLSTLELPAEEHAWSLPIAVELASDSSHVVLTCRSGKQVAKIFIVCDNRKGDRVVDSPPAVSVVKRLGVKARVTKRRAQDTVKKKVAPVKAAILTKKPSRGKAPKRRRP